MPEEPRVVARPNAQRMTRMAGGSARANRNRAEVRALAEESRAAKYPMDVQFAAEDPYPPTGAELRAARGTGRLAAIRQLAAQGKSPSDIAVELGVDVIQVNTWIRQFHIKTPAG